VPGSLRHERHPLGSRRSVVVFAALLILSWFLRLFWQHGLPPKGIVRNQSNGVLWVVENDSGRAIAHLLAPGLRSPQNLDADGVMDQRRTPISGHVSWWKARDISIADVRSEAGNLTIDCLTCSAVFDLEFGPVLFDESPGWGQPP
jgi:hypothetical protein